MKSRSKFKDLLESSDEKQFCTSASLVGCSWPRTIALALSPGTYNAALPTHTSMFLTNGKVLIAARRLFPRAARRVRPLFRSSATGHSLYTPPRHFSTGPVDPSLSGGEAHCLTNGDKGAQIPQVTPPSAVTAPPLERQEGCICFSGGARLKDTPADDR